MAQNEKIMEVLRQLDPLDDDQWTADGAPKVETVAALLGGQVTRQEIVNAAPDFNRERAGKPEEKPKEANYPNQTVDRTDNDGDGRADPVDDSQPRRQFDAGEFRTYLEGVDLDDLEEMQEDLERSMSRNASEQERLREEASQMKMAKALLKLRLRAESPNSSDTDATRAYIEAQNRTRAERAELRNSVLKGLRPKDLQTKSPLDEAMARKNTRGTTRPNRS